MKFTITFSILFLFCITSFSQVRTNVKSDTIIKANDLKGKQWIAWYTIDSIWIHHIFPACLNENHVKLNCASCESVYILAQIKIDSAGKLVSYKNIKNNMCGKDISKNMEKCFFDFFYFIEFPAELRNMILEVNIGNGLKC